ncbi:MAG: hypothetical protein HY473_01965 [Candidatus Sungbacteria bacterium]|uniref:DUF4015 domain-containing protein n=1 Tax=Candidatus Sungiibacteriota bacterium TaxID=2750080 RepID=A0A932YYX3_9BACT|nr:hypothetical protein [Candidatus Sungbacteria bacterium]
MKWFWIAAIAIIATGGGFLFSDYYADPGKLIVNTALTGEGANQKSMAERIREAEERSRHVKGVYMTSAVANDLGRPATKLRNDIIALVDETNLNAVVIDVKETTGGAIITDGLKNLVQTLHQKGIWVIARQVVFKDDSQEKNHPGWYLRRSDARLPDGQGAIWRDNRRGSWLDPASPEVWQYQLDVAKRASDAGFDEIQFDYIRFPSDGDVRAIVYPVYDPKRPKYEVLREFFAYLHNGLKRHRPDLILSADLFGYVALQQQDLGIGQRLQDIGENFDYVSLMVYPSHYYAGFQVSKDAARNLPALYYPYRSASSTQTATAHPYEVVYRSLLIAQDILEGRVATRTDQAGQSASGLDKVATSSIPSISPVSPVRRARLRPWLQDFNLGVDTSRGIYYDAKKVRAQIEAAEAAGASGWLLWNAENIYTKEALRKENGG